MLIARSAMLAALVFTVSAVAVAAAPEVVQGGASAGLSASEPHVAPANAGCVVRSGDKILLVRDVWSQRWGLPGGGFEPGEGPGDTAARETWEETGVQAVAQEHLGTTLGGFEAWGCVLRGPVSMAGPDTVALPKHARGEVAEARFIDPGQLAPAELRFPSQAADLRAWAAAATSVDARLLQLRPVPTGGPMGRALWLSRALAAPELPPMRAALGLASSLAALPAIALLVVWLAGWAGWRQAAELLLLTTLAAFCAAVVRDLTALPRPGDLDVGLAGVTTRGFAFPSHHATVVTCLWGALAARTGLAGSRWAAAVAIALCSLAQMALGAHFFHDVAGGALLAGAGVALHGRALKAAGRPWLLARTWVYLWAAALAAAAAVGPLGPTQVLALGLALGCAAAASLAPPAACPAGAHWRPSGAGHDRIGAAAAAVVLMLATAAGGALAAPREATFFASLAHRAGLALCLGAALPLGAALTRQRRDGGRLGEDEAGGHLKDAASDFAQSQPTEPAGPDRPSHAA